MIPFRESEAHGSRRTVMHILVSLHAEPPSLGYSHTVKNVP